MKSKRSLRKKVQNEAQGTKERGRSLVGALPSPPPLLPLITRNHAKLAWSPRGLKEIAREQGSRFTKGVLDKHSELRG